MAIRARRGLPPQYTEAAGPLRPGQGGVVDTTEDDEEASGFQVSNYEHFLPFNTTIDGQEPSKPPAIRMPLPLVSPSLYLFCCILALSK